MYILHERQVPQAVRLSDSRKKAAFAAHLSIFFLQSDKDRETAVGNDPVEAMEYLANTVREEEGISRVNEAKRSARRFAGRFCRLFFMPDYISESCRGGSALLHGPEQIVYDDVISAIAPGAEK